MRIVVRTAPFYAGYQLPIVMFFTVLFLAILAVSVSGGYFQTDPYLTIFVALIAALFLWRILFRTMQSWFNDVFTVVLEDDLLTGQNLFGKKIKVEISEIASVVPLREGFKGLAFVTADGRRFGPVVNIDLLTFIYDYILTRLPSSCEYDTGLIDELRHDSSYWSYERNSEGGAYYTGAELKVLREFSRNQFSELKERGILRDSVKYGSV